MDKKQYAGPQAKPSGILATVETFGGMIHPRHKAKGYSL